MIIVAVLSASLLVNAQLNMFPMMRPLIEAVQTGVFAFLSDGSLHFASRRIILCARTRALGVRATQHQGEPVREPEFSGAVWEHGGAAHGIWWPAMTETVSAPVMSLGYAEARPLLCLCRVLPRGGDAVGGGASDDGTRAPRMCCTTTMHSRRVRFT